MRQETEMDMKQFYRTTDYLLMLLGIFLIVDRLALHWIRFNYKTINLGWLDQWFDHWMIGVLLIMIALWDLRQLSK